jgi:hypothetical protein
MMGLGKIVPLTALDIRAPDKIALVTAEALRSVDPLWRLDIVLPLDEELQVQLRT